MSTTEDPSISVEMDVRDDRTILTIEGKRDAAVIVRSESGERIYLPPEDFDSESSGTTAYSTTPYSTMTEDDEEVTTPYSKTVDASVSDDEKTRYGRTSMPAGIRIVHPEPVTDFRIVR